jgi:serine O-acetyltransferase
MYRLKQLLYSDLARQYALEGKASAEPSLLGLLRRVPHPRFLPIVLCRSARASLLARIPLLPQLFTYLNVVLFGIEITPRCEIGPGIFFPHTSGTVVGAGSLGNEVTVYQGVTLGAKTLDMRFDPAQRPSVGDRVVLGSGAKILGGIHIGDNVIVGANAVVVHSIPANSRVTGIPMQAVTLLEEHQ